MINREDIKNKVHEAEEPLSDNAWAGMEQLLDAEKSQGRSRMLWFGAAVALIVLLFGVYTFMDINTTQPEQLEQPLVVQPKGQEQTSPEETKQTAGEYGVVNEAKVEDGVLAVERSEPSRESETTANTGQKAIVEEAYTEASPLQSETSKAAVEQGGQAAIPNTPEALESRLAPEKNTHKTKTVQTEPTTVLPAKPIGLPHHAWSSPSPKIFGVGSPIIASTSENTGAAQVFNYRWEVRAFAMTTYNLAPGSYLTKSPTTHVDYARATDNAVKPGLGFDAGVEVKYRVFNYFKIGGGIEYRKLTNTVNFDFQSNKIPLLDSTGGHIIDYLETPTPRVYRFSGNNTYTFISIPISLYYEVPLKGRWSLGAEAIYNHSFLLRQTSTGVNPTRLTIEQQEDEVYQHSLGSAQFRLSLMYQLTPSFYLAAEPAYRQYMNPFNKTENVHWTPRDLSLSLSVLYRFNTLK